MIAYSLFFGIWPRFWRRPLSAALLCSPSEWSNHGRHLLLQIHSSGWHRIYPLDDRRI